MIKRKLNREQLRRILAPDVENERLDALEFAGTLRKFADGYLRGVMTVDVIGTANGYVNIKLPVLSYLIRLIAEVVDDEPAHCTVRLSDRVEIETHYPKIADDSMTAYLIDVAKLTGFKVKRASDILYFSTDIITSPLMKIYATSQEKIMEYLVIVWEM